MSSILLDQLRSFYEARPFKAFEIVLSDGRRLLVDAPEHVGWSTRMGRVIYANEQDTFDLIPMDEVVNIHPAILSERGGPDGR